MIWATTRELLEIVSRFDNQGVKFRVGGDVVMELMERGQGFGGAWRHRKRLGREIGGVEFLRSCSRSLYHNEIKTASRASPLYNRFLYPPPSLQTWSIRDLVSHEILLSHTARLVKFCL